MPTLNPYKGNSRKLVVAFDIGTTYSGASYTVLDPGVVPQVHCVTRYPGQGAGDAKIPSILYYTKKGKVRAVGAEAAEDSIEAEVEEEGLVFVEWFKMHLRPASMLESGKTEMALKPLPKGKTVVDVTADFLKYLFDCTKSYIQEAHPNGDSLWDSVSGTYEVILSHPNGWGGIQQTRMREAAVRSGIIPDSTAGSDRLHFVMEGEASINYCISLGLAETSIEAGTSVMVIDAGGGTVDISSYCFKKTSPAVLEETAPAECLLQGSTIINSRAEKLLRSKLANSKFRQDGDIAAMMSSFERATKRSFKSENDKSFIKFGRVSDNDKSVNVRAGQLSLTGAEVAKLFQPSIEAIVDNVKSQCEASSEKISLIFVVGGFAASPYLFSELKSKLGKDGLNVSRPECSTNKAVADGALWHYLGGYVAARVARWTYGTTGAIGFDVDDPEHIARKDRTFLGIDGELGIAGGFSPLLVKGTRMRENMQVSTSYCKMSPFPFLFPRNVSMDILCYRGKKTCPKWADEEPDCFTTLCKVEADVPNVDVLHCRGPLGIFFVKAFDVVLTCGQTEMKASLQWEEDGVEKRSDAKIVYEDDIQEKK